ncbi:Caffeine resistance protein 5 [Fulvia fulva]|uniref:Cercosporin MFS transporter CTB4 n=1 Tax=Passalora fulva TaxID=5499 RepID=A0A9Q8P9I5_PASFU|nr:Caffeine resistance protein 5 [Fulvia fulva]KAK4624702.1 Caffeine resistance protein 5 [Fulvia fulva]KAK4625229.1 Caffeine resistance protein 5 [Fulvia fulva]UJO18092.1 Caffeine resistance protein 5 [Fulvia fulva]WPV15411.1 Caffeine resistance protein 5 [Fulvia fulva]WPV30232.1 Caffeine resistance protein 5 [Fulvia fulva]
MPLKDFFRETFVGRMINIISRNRLLRAPTPELPQSDKLGHQLSRQSSLNRSASRSSADEIAEKGAGGHLVDWSSTTDPDNPQNWPLWKKLYSTAVICILTFSIYVGSAIYTVGLEGITEQFQVGHGTATLGLSLFVFGYGIGPMILAPFAEAPPIGRMPVYVITHLIFLFLNFGVVYAKDIGMLLAFRFLTGFFGSPVLATGGASLGDVWSPKKVSYAIGIWGNFAICGPVLGPLAAGFAVQAKGWKWSIWELIWLNAFTAVLLVFTLVETSSDNILFRRATKIRKMTGDKEFKTAAEIEAERMPVKEIVISSLYRPFMLCFTEPILMAQNLYLGLIYALLYCWFEAFPLVFNGIYHFNLGELGLSYIGLLVGAVIFTIPYFYWIRKKIEPNTNEDGTIAPEKRLPAAIVGSLFLPICLFWVGWSARSSVHWIMPISGSAFFTIGAGTLFNALLSYQSDAYPKVVGSVLAGNDFARAMFGCSLLGFLSIAFIPIPIAIYYYGERSRKSSKYARHDI